MQRRPLIRAATARRQSAQQGMLLATGLALLAVLSIVVLIVPR